MDASSLHRARAMDLILARLGAAMNRRAIAVLWDRGVPALVEIDESIVPDVRV